MKCRKNQEQQLQCQWNQKFLFCPQSKRKLRIKKDSKVWQKCRSSKNGLQAEGDAIFRNWVTGGRTQQHKGRTLCWHAAVASRRPKMPGNQHPQFPNSEGWAWNHYSTFKRFTDGRTGLRQPRESTYTDRQQELESCHPLRPDTGAREGEEMERQRQNKEGRVGSGIAKTHPARLGNHKMNYKKIGKGISFSATHSVAYVLTRRQGRDKQPEKGSYNGGGGVET